MFVYVQNKYGQPLMPTTRCGKVRRLLKAGKAKAVKRCPFTIRLLYDTGDIVQEVDLGIDAGSKVIGLSACIDSRELRSRDRAAPGRNRESVCKERVQALKKVPQNKIP